MLTFWTVIFVGTSMITGKIETRIMADHLTSRAECEELAKKINDADWSDRAMCVKRGEE